MGFIFKTTLKKSLKSIEPSLLNKQRMAKKVVAQRKTQKMILVIMGMILIILALKMKAKTTKMKAN